MHLLQLLFRVSPGISVLLLCLQMGTNKAQEDTRRVITMNVNMSQEVEANKEVTLKLIVETELRECMVIKTYLQGSRPMDGPFSYVYTTCLCKDYPRTFYWDFEVNGSMAIAPVVHIIDKEGICPNISVVPNGETYYYTIKGIRTV